MEDPISMTSRISLMPDNLDWKQAYLAAVLEANPVSILVLIHKAREKLGTRLHELYADGSGVCDEVEAIHDAAYMLFALQCSLLHRDDDSAEDQAVG